MTWSWTRSRLHATELTRASIVDRPTLDRLSRHFDEREICDIVWLVASEHVSNMTNSGLHIGSDDLCAVRPPMVRPGR